MPIIKHGGPKNISHLKSWDSKLPTMRNAGLDDGFSTSKNEFAKFVHET